MFMKLYNTIIYGNTSPTNPNWFKEYFTTSNIHVRNSIIQGSGGSAAWNTFYGTNDGNNMDVNPQFTSTTQDQENFTLLASSPGIDASYNQQLNLPNTNNSWTANDTDVYGNSRLVGNGVDLGAVEKGQSLSIIEVNPKVSFYSNNGILYFDDLSVVINKTITVYDLNGKAVYSTKLETNQTSLPKLATGVYILQVENLKGIKFLVH
jgi:hypothetical protein